MSTAKVTNLQHESAASPNIVLGADGSVSVGGGGLSPQTGFKNRIINGDMRIDQRNAGASVTPSAVETYTVDRFSYIGTQSSKIAFQQNQGSYTPPVGFANYLGFTTVSPVASPAAGDQFACYHKIEGYNIADLNWGTANATTISVSFWVRSSLTGTFSGGLVNSAGNRSYIFNFTVNSANTFEHKTITIAGDTTGTWLITNGAGIQLRFDLGSGTNQEGTVNAWQAGDKMRTAGSNRVIGTNGATFYITGVQLEKGSVATPFEFRSIGQELALCQRYYEKIGGEGSAYPVFQTYCSVGSSFGTSMFFKVSKRAAPSLTLAGTWVVANSSQPIVDASNTHGFRIYAIATATARCFFETGGADQYVAASAEL